MKLYFYLLITLFCSCSAKVVITGEYASKTSPHRFNLKSDSTFLYTYNQFHSYLYSVGSWKKASKNKVVLNSSIKSNIILLNVRELNKSESVQNDTNFIAVNVDIPNTHKEDYLCAMFINDTLYNERRCDSLSLIWINSPIREIYFEIRKRPLILNDLRLSVDPVVTNKFLTKSIMSNKLKIDITVSDSLFSYKIFSDEILEIKKNSLKFYDTKSNKWESVSKVSDTSIVFMQQ